MTLGKQARLEVGCSSVPSIKGVINKGKGTRGPIGMSEITRVSCDGHKGVVEYNELGQPIGKSATKLKSFIGTTVRVHVPISCQSWKDVPTELKDKIYELIEKASTSNGELIDHALDNLLVSKRASHSIDNVTCDILSQAIGGNDPPGRIQGVGQYVTPSKYFHTAREKRKKVGKEEDYAEERARMATRILELEAELMKHKRVPEVATKGETDESKIKSQMASKSIDTSDDANDHDAKEENRQVLEHLIIEDLTIEKQDKDGTSCRLAIGTKDNVVGAGTIFDYDMDGDNVKVSVDMVTDGKVSVVIPLDEKMKSVYQADPRLPSLTLNTKRAPVTLRLLLWELDYIGSKIQIHVPAKVFGYERKCCIFLEALQEFYQMQPISTQCIDAFMFKEDRGEILNARLLGTAHHQILMFPYNSGLVIPSDYAVISGSNPVGSLHHVCVIIMVIPKDTHVGTTLIRS
uniref:Serine/threonine-protein kinase nek2 n=1 Tax=Cucumis melo TaxID=3656 RepID=A0A9I9E6C2_CUCME